MFVVAHPEAEHHVQKLVGGQYDSRLTERGRAQARRIADSLHERLATSARRVTVTSSDLLRCAETAEIIGARLGLPVLLDPRLRERSYGMAGGRPQAWLDERQVIAPDDDRLDFRDPIPGTETLREVATRVGECVAELISASDSDHVVVTHGGAQNYVITSWMGIPVDAVGFASFRAPSGSITHLDHHDYWRNRRLVTLGDVTHLAES